MSNNKVKLKRIKILSPIWIVPILTILVAIWMAVDAYSKRGFEITLVAENASNIIEGKTLIKSRDVTIGVVEKIAFNNDFNKVLITARIKDIGNKLINNDSLFWIVTPTITKNGISGLSTLVSGSYIELISQKVPKKRGSSNKVQFELLTHKPIASEANEGVNFDIVAKKDANILNIGDKVIYKSNNVGYISNRQLDNNGSFIYSIFINKPYHKLINKNTIFWVNSGVTFNLSPQGIDFNLSSIEQVLAPVIEFDLLETTNDINTTDTHNNFILFKNKAESDKHIFKYSKQFVLLFDQDITGLTNNSLIKYRGLTIGRVLEVPYRKILNQQKLQFNTVIPVLISIEPERVTGLGIDNTEFLQQFVQAQKQGLRASLENPNLLTGARDIQLTMQANLAKNIKIKTFDGIDELLTIHTNNSLESVVQKLNNLPLERTLQQLNQTMAAYQEGSTLYNNLNGNLNELGKTLNQITPLLNTLNKKSNALIFAPADGKDPIPAAKK